MHLELSALDAGLDEIRQAPTDAGTVELVIRRPSVDEREVLTEAQIDTVAGIVGDRWRGTGADPDRQVTVMNARVVALLAQSRERWPLAGDQLYVDLDISDQNLPPGTRIQVGTAVLEVTAAPHRGCKKFAARYGLDALRFVNSEVGYALNLRGINTRVVEGGVVRPGDAVGKLSPVAADQPVAADRPAAAEGTILDR
jgi:MOSC domain-containing protein YiiM